MAKIALKLIQELRTRTGLGMLDCKKALENADGDIQEAVKLLRKKGAKVAEKRAGMATSEGIIHAYIHPGSKMGVLVEVDCETDFVARTDDFKQFATDLGMHIAAMKPLFLAPENVDADFLQKEKDVIKEQLKASGKPEKLIDKIVEGKVNKIYSEICLLKQTFVKNDQITIEELLKELVGKLGENIKIGKFCRFEIGA